MYKKQWIKYYCACPWLGPLASTQSVVSTQPLGRSCQVCPFSCPLESPYCYPIDSSRKFRYEPSKPSGTLIIGRHILYQSHFKTNAGVALKLVWPLSTNSQSLQSTLIHKRCSLARSTSSHSLPIFSSRLGQYCSCHR